MLPEKKDIPSAVVWTVRRWCLDRKRVPQARFTCCTSSVVVTAECSLHHTSRNVSWPQRAPNAGGHEAAIICQVERYLPGHRLANQTCQMNCILS